MRHGQRSRSVVSRTCRRCARSGSRSQAVTRRTGMSTLVPTWNGTQSKLLWAAIAALGAASFGIIALEPGRDHQCRMARHRRGLRLLHRLPVLRACSSPRRCCRSIRNRPTPAHRHNDGLDYVPTNQVRAVRPPFRGDRRRRSAGRPGAGGADGLPARHAVDPGRRRVRRRGAGHDRAVPVHPARRPLARRHDPLRDGTGGRRHRAASAC